MHKLNDIVKVILIDAEMLKCIAASQLLFFNVVFNFNCQLNTQQVVIHCCCNYLIIHAKLWNMY